MADVTMRSLVPSLGRPLGRRTERDLLIASADGPIQGRFDAAERWSAQPPLSQRPNGLGR
jgi:hypothetical protein